MLVFSVDKMSALNVKYYSSLCADVEAFLANNFSDRLTALKLFSEQTVKKGLRYRLRSRSDFYTFATSAYLFGLHFDEDPLLPWAVARITYPEIEPSQRMETLRSICELVALEKLRFQTQYRMGLGRIYERSLMLLSENKISGSHLELFLKDCAPFLARHLKGSDVENAIHYSDSYFSQRIQPSEFYPLHFTLSIALGSGFGRDSRFEYIAKQFDELSRCQTGHDLMSCLQAATHENGQEASTSW